MKTKPLLAFGALACCLCGCLTVPESEEEGFVPLFNGRDLSGWEGATNTYCVSSEGGLKSSRNYGVSKR